MPRRGELLLVILGLLAMFALVAVALVVLTTPVACGAPTRSACIDQAADPPQRVLDQAMRQVVRGSNNPASVIGPHSLLETMYGNMAISGDDQPRHAALAAGSCSNSPSAQPATLTLTTRPSAAWAAAC